MLVIKPAFDDARKFRDGLAPVNVTDKWGYIDTRGKVVVTPQFDDARIFSFGIAAVKLEDKWGYINLKGQFVIPGQFELARTFMEAGDGQGPHGPCKDPRQMRNDRRERADCHHTKFR
jgi:hypothetical protein